MPAKRELTMRQLRYMLRPQHDGVSAREIGRTLGVARSTIQDNLRRAQASGIAWPVPAGLTDDILEQRLFARGGMKAGLRRRSEPDWGTLAREALRRRARRLQLHLCGGDLHTNAGGLNRLACADVPLLRRRAAAGRAGAAGAFSRAWRASSRVVHSSCG